MVTTGLPLADKRILVTRAPHQSAEFNALLRAQGATPVTIPVLEIVPPESWRELDQALTNLDNYQYIILTSVNAVDAVQGRLQHLGMIDKIITAESNLRWVCVGPKTAQALREIEGGGREPDLQPDVYRAEAVIELLQQRGVDGMRILYPRAQLARKLIPQQLGAAGAIVDAPVAYRTIPATTGGEQLCSLLRQQQLDIVTFTSSSSVDNFVAAIGDECVALTASVLFASIGPLTSATARKHGLTVAVEAREYTLEGLIAELIDYYK